MNLRFISIALLFSMIWATASNLSAQEAELITTKLQAGYFKDQANQERVVAKLLRKNERYEPFPNAEIQFFALKDTSRTLLQKINTDEKGEAVLILSEELKASSGPTGLMAFEMTYAGDAKTESASKDIQVSPAQLKVAFFQEDTSKFISVEAAAPDATGAMAPLAGLEIGLFVKGTFSYLSIAKDVSGPDGKLVVPFPLTMPGDSAGVITIAAKVEDNDIYGNLESWGVINWAKPVPIEEKVRRGLGDTDAPLWMVYTLIVLLSAVWFHYAYVIYLVIKIKLAKHHT